MAKLRTWPRPVRLLLSTRNEWLIKQYGPPFPPHGQSIAGGQPGVLPAAHVPPSATRSGHRPRPLRALVKRRRRTAGGNAGCTAKSTRIAGYAPPLSTRWHTLFTFTNKLFTFTNDLFRFTDDPFTFTNGPFASTKGLLGFTGVIFRVSNTPFPYADGHQGSAGPPPGYNTPLPRGLVGR